MWASLATNSFCAVRHPSDNLWHNLSIRKCNQFRHPTMWQPCLGHGLQTKGYFHSTRLMQALRMGLLRVRQNRALGGLLLVEPPCFLLLAYCCLFFCASEPTGGGPVVQTGGGELMSRAAPSPCAWRAALMAACQARTGLTPAPPWAWTPLLVLRSPG